VLQQNQLLKQEQSKCSPFALCFCKATEDVLTAIQQRFLSIPLVFPEIQTGVDLQIRWDEQTNPQCYMDAGTAHVM
jgi:hypothetical protein